MLYGEGAVELDALEALHPGELARLTREGIKQFIDETLPEKPGRPGKNSSGSCANVLFYNDPPYYPDTRQDNHLYHLEMTRERHQELAKILNGIKGMAALSGYRCPEYDEWYLNWERHDLVVHCHLSSYGSVRHFREETRPRRIESLWLNPAAAKTEEGKVRQLSFFDLDGWEEASR